MVGFEQSFIYFGGYGVDGNSVIAKFDSTTRQWSNIGNLMTGRDHHSAIFDGSYFLVVGGLGGSFKTEKCSLVGSSMTCEQQEPELVKYEAYPELFLVDDDYCKNT